MRFGILRVPSILAIMCVGSLYLEVRAADVEIAEQDDADLADLLDREERAKQLVEQALLAGQSGDQQRREALLNEAITIAPDSKLARWHAGQVRHEDRWFDISEAEKVAEEPTLLAQYRKRREAAKETVDDQLELAKWCRSHELEDEARAHFSKVLRLDSGNAVAIEGLGLEQYKGQWLTKDQIASRIEEEANTVERSKQLKPTLIALRRDLNDRESEETARERLRQTVTPENLKLLEDVFPPTSPRWGMEAVAILDAMQQQSATEALARYAISTDSKEVRAAAVSALKKRSLENVVPTLLDALRSPIQADVEVINDGDQVRIRHTVKQEGADTDRAKAKELRLGIANPNPFASRLIRGTVNKTLNDAARSKASLERANKAAELQNKKIYDVLAQLTDAKVVPEPRAWWDWWMDYNGLTVTPGRPLYEDAIVLNHEVPTYVPNAAPYDYKTLVVPAHSPPSSHSCFQKGTMVWTLEGTRPIETIRVGDRVLSQDAKSGELAYKPVLNTTVRFSGKMMTINLGTESITATPGHPFWLVGKGWTITKRMKVGDRLYGVNGGAVVRSIQEADRTDAYNLVVADFQSYFVGQQRLLVHDNSPVKATAKAAPGIEIDQATTEVAAN